MWVLPHRRRAQFSGLLLQSMTPKSTFLALSMVLTAISTALVTEGQDAVVQKTTAAQCNANGELMQPVGYREWMPVAQVFLPAVPQVFKPAGPSGHRGVLGRGTAQPTESRRNGI